MTVLYLGVHDEQSISLTVAINALYPLRIIGLNQDTRSDGQGMAGLTFMFTEPMAKNVPFGELSYSWVEPNAPIPYNWKETGGDLAQSVKDKLVTVNKQWMNQGRGINYAATSTAKCFLLSGYELGRNIDGGKGVLGVGKNKDEMYLHFDSLGIAPGGTNNSRIIQSFNLGECWLRDRVGKDASNIAFMISFVDSTGNFGDQHSNHTRNMVPCFCL